VNKFATIVWIDAEAVGKRSEIYDEIHR